MADVKQPAKGKAASHDREKMPPAGPHAKPELTDEEKTPGSGMLPDPVREPKSTEAPTG
jgi:hypothetical protein